MTEDLLDEAWSRGRAAFPELPLLREAFGAYLEARPTAANGALDHAADLYLACACLTGVPRAADLFLDRHLGQKLPAYLGRLASSSDFVAEVRQVLSIRLLVGDEETAPRLGEYGGRGPLEGWVRIAATRTALNLVRGTARRASFTEAVERRMIDEGGDLAFLKQTYREPLRRALAAAATELDRAHRIALRLHYVEGLTTAQLAAFFGVSRPTAVRRIAGARAALVDGVKDKLRESLHLAESDFAEVLDLVRSQLDVSLARLLRETFS